MNADKLIGQVIAERFKIIRLLGEGGFGSVYLATQLGLDRHVAVKVLHQYIVADESLRRFEREAHILAGIQHKNIVTCHAFGLLLDKVPYMVLELVDGPTLRTILQQNGKLDWREAFKIGLDLCDAMSCIHNAGLVHRDLKPENLIILEDRTAKVIDFGLVHSEEQRLTKTGCVVGTLAYMSPEHATGEKVTALSDIFALGCILYESIAGRPPYLFNDGLPDLRAFGVQPPLISSTISTVPTSVDFVLSKAISTSPEHRYQNAEDLRRDLLAVLQGNRPDGMPAVVTYGSSTAAHSSHSFVVIAISCIVMAVIAAAYIGSLQRSNSPNSKTEAAGLLSADAAEKAVRQASELRANGLYKESIALEDRIGRDGSLERMMPSARATYFMNIANCYASLKDYRKGADLAKEGMLTVPITRQEQGSLLHEYIKCCLHLPLTPQDQTFLSSHLTNLKSYNQTVSQSDETAVELAALNLAADNEAEAIAALSEPITHHGMAYPTGSTYVLMTTPVNNRSEYLGLQLSRLCVYCSMNKDAELGLKAVNLAERNAAFNEFRTKDKLGIRQRGAWETMMLKRFSEASSELANTESLLASCDPASYDQTDFLGYAHVRATTDREKYGAPEAVTRVKKLLSDSKTPAWKRILLFETLAELYNQTNAPEDAYKVFATAAKEFPNDILLLIQWAETCRRLDREQESKALCAKARTISPKNADWIMPAVLGRH